MRDYHLTAEPGSLRRDAEHIVELDQITDHTILEDEEREKFDGAKTFREIWITHVGLSEVRKLYVGEPELGCDIFAKLVEEAGDGFEIDALSGRITIIADTQDEYDDALESLAIQLCDTDSGGGHARESLRRVLDR